MPVRDWQQHNNEVCYYQKRVIQEKKKKKKMIISFVNIIYVHKEDEIILECCSSYTLYRGKCKAQ